MPGASRRLQGAADNLKREIAHSGAAGLRVLARLRHIV